MKESYPQPHKLPYNLKAIHRPFLAVDILIFTIIQNELQILLIQRGVEPFKDTWAIPGGFVKENESLDKAALRELKEETGANNVYLEQLYSFGEPKRDPRGRVVSVAYFALVPPDQMGRLKARSDAKAVGWFSVKKVPKLAFDHKEILKYALARLQWKLEYTNVVFSLLDNEFTLTDLQKIYEIVYDRTFDKRNFRRKFLSLGLIEPTGKTVLRGVQRPAQTFCFKSKKLTIVDIFDP